MRGGSIEEIWTFLRGVPAPMRRIVIAWIVGCFFQDAPRFGAIITGPQGTSKTTMTKMLRLVVDPAKALTSRVPRDEKDLALKCLGNGVLTFDNLSRLSSDMADVLCSTLTGEGYEARQLYTDKDQVIFTYRRPLILNGISGISNRPDLLDRCLAIQLERFKPDEKRRQERELWASFDAALPRLLGAVLDAVVGALRTYPSVVVPAGIRMADAAIVGVALEKALGWPEGSYADAVNFNDKVQTAEILAESLLTAPIGKLLDAAAPEALTGTAAELLEDLNVLVGKETSRKREWPKTPSALAGDLDRLAMAFGKSGISVDRSYEHGGVKVISIRRTRGASDVGMPPEPPRKRATPPTPATPRDNPPPVCRPGVAGVAGVGAQTADPKTTSIRESAELPGSPPPGRQLSIPQASDHGFIYDPDEEGD